MSLAALLNQNVSIIRRGSSSTDSEGNYTDAWEDAEFLKGRVEQVSGTEFDASATGQVRRWRAFFPPDVEIAAEDRVVVDSLTFEVIGPPGVQYTPRGPHHIEVELRHVEV